MCGIFGAVILPSSSVYKNSQEIAHALFSESERRGKEASGFISVSRDEIGYMKYPGTSSELWKNKKNLLRRDVNDSSTFAFVGHTRLVTNGVVSDNLNNQPVRVGGVIGVHNGIIVNDAELWQSNPGLTQTSQVDTEVFIAILNSLRVTHGIIDALSSVHASVYGTASLALLFDDLDQVVLSTNNGSLYVYQDSQDGVCVFASEFRILEAVISKYFPHSTIAIENIHPNHGAIIGLDDARVQNFDFSATTKKIAMKSASRILVDYSEYSPQPLPSLFVNDAADAKVLALYEHTKKIVCNLRRCTHCILPETFPGITFDRDGVCDICRTYVRITLDANGGSALKEAVLSKQRSLIANIVGVDMVMGFSGGRDSCYGLHYIVKELGLRPIVYTYDWGVITDLGRRNQSRLCAKLGIEHVLVSADIAKKREYIRKNILAWMRDPDLGMVPLFMAGDKQYFSHLNFLAKDLFIDNILLCENPLERTLFKYRFADMHYDDLSTTTYQTSWSQKFSILFYYGKKILMNSGYWNTSLLDTFSGFISYFIHSNTASYQQLFSYIPWDEKIIDETLRREYDWEFSPDTETSWRIGDGTAPWYNLIYYIGAGFSEQETFRSNQVREGKITRDEALVLAERDNYPRIPSLRWYFETMQVDMGCAIDALERLPRRYARPK